MKKLLICLSLTLLMATAVSADEKDREACGLFERLGSMIMEVRQEGTKMRVLYEVVAEYEDLDGYDSMREMLLEFVVEAYDYPRFSQKEYQEEMVKKFSNKVYLDCIKTATN